jgi:hypothetical protein
MAEPPRLSEITLPEEKSIIYFVTLCVRGRRKVLANAKMFDAIDPVRHGLVQKAEAWPYYLDFVNDHGKLAASPTETQRT